MMPPGGGTVYIGNAVTSDREKMQFQLKFALDRALRAEKALVTLKFQQSKEKLENEMKKAEEEYLTKMKIYNTIPEQLARIQDEFTKKVKMIENAISYERQVHMMSLTGLDQGLTMDELPTPNPNQSPDSYRIQIFAKISEKQLANQKSSTNVSTSQHQGQANGMPAGISTYCQQLPTSAPLTSQANHYNPVSVQNSPQLQITIPQSINQFPNGGNAAYVPNNYKPQQNLPMSGMPMQHAPSQQVSVPIPVSNDPTYSAVKEPAVENIVIQAAKVSIASNVPPPSTTQTTHEVTPSAKPKPDVMDTRGPGEGFENNTKELNSYIKERTTPTNDLYKNTTICNEESSVGLDDFPVDDDMFQSDEPNKIALFIDTGHSEPEDGQVHSENEDSDDDDDEQFALSLLKTQGGTSAKPVQASTVSYAKMASTSSKTNNTTPTRQGAATKPAETKSDSAATAGTQKFNPYKTSLCREYMDTKKCRHGEYCLFAHGEKELKMVKKDKLEGNEFYKTHICKVFAAGEECRYGDHCNFAHGRHELRKPTFYKKYEAPAEDDNQSTDSGERHENYKTLICKFYAQGEFCVRGDTCDFAHGAGELRRTPYYLMPNPPSEPVRNSSGHQEPCDDQECPAKLAFLLRKTTPCTFYPRGMCKNGDRCRYAHGDHELKEMPKWEICERSKYGECPHMESPERCVYAHSPKELKKNPYANKKPSLRTVGISGGLPAESPSTPVDGDECAICMGQLLERKNLMKCGHNNFHERCISQWLTEREASCPLCREPAQPPTDYQPQDFPKLR